MVKIRELRYVPIRAEFNNVKELEGSGLAVDIDLNVVLIISALEEVTEVFGSVD